MGNAIWNLICSICKFAVTVGILYSLITAPKDTPELLRWVAIGVIWAIPTKTN